jgi:hypothetical protein
MSKLEIPELIYHYTSNDVLLKILEHKTLRLSAKHHLNDTLEGDQFFALLRTHPSGPNSSRIDGLRDALDPFEFFVTCFSSMGDHLSQWRGYAANGTGVSIGFKTKPILNLIKGSKEALLYPVAYADEVGKLPNNRAKTINAMLTSTGSPSLDAIQAFVKERWAIKPSGFEEEHETRLIVTIDSRSGTLQPTTPWFRIKYLATGSEVRESCEFLLGSSVEAGVIESITLGPNNRTNVGALHRALVYFGLPNVVIQRSKLSYR